MAADEGEFVIFQEKRQYEQALMRAGRRLQSVGQLLEQDPARVVGKGFDFDPDITGPRPLQIELDEMRAMFDPQAPQNVGQLLAEYQQLLARDKPKA